MNRKWYALLLPFLLPAVAEAQIIDTGSMWTWIRGASTIGQASITTPPGSATPGARSSAMGWTDKNGNFWLFGGDFVLNSSRCSDLWKFDPAAGSQWTLEHGVTTYNAAPDYGGTTAPGTASAATTPGNRKWSASWTDKDGNLWMFGGMYNESGNQTIKNDLWKFDVVSKQWRWMGGKSGTNDAGKYGTKGTAEADNIPGSRGYGNGPAYWVDKAGNFWMFGGFGITPKQTLWFLGTGLNDLWKYNVQTNQWTWVKGSDDATQPGTYGIKGTPHADNTPGTRGSSVFWTDTSGNFWLFGGYGCGKNTSVGWLNDLWKFDPITERWTWVNGPDTVNGPGIYGTRGAAASSNQPGARQSGTNGWTDSYGNLWMFGGVAYDKVRARGIINDLWKYNIQTDQWTWMKGDDVISKNGVYGATPLPANAPGSRNENLAWKDASGNFWLFGGSGLPETGTTTGSLNDMWRLGTVLPPLPVQPGAYTVAKRNVCAGETSVIYTVPAVAYGTSYEWQYITGTGVSFPGGSVTPTPTNSLNFSTSATSGTLRVRAKNAAGDGPWRDTAITVGALPALTVTPSSSGFVCQGDSLALVASVSGGGVSYQWQNGVTPVGTSATYYTKVAGTFTVTATNTTTNCSAISAPVTVTLGTPPSLTITPAAGPGAICQGDSILLSATATGVTYEWKRGTALTGTASSYYAKDAGSYTVTVTSTANGCKTTSSPVSLSVNPLPTVSVTPTGGPVVCQGESVLLTAASGTNYTYQWKKDLTPVGAGGNTYSAGATGGYKVIVTESVTGCKDSSQPLSVTVLQRPAGSLHPGDTAFCEGGIVRLEVQSADTGLTYRWKNGSATISLAVAHFLEVKDAGSYTVIVGRQAAAGCEDTTNAVTVTVYPLPVADITWDGALLHALPGYAGYQWHIGMQAIAGETDSLFRPTANGSYFVTVVDSNGCSAASQVYNVTKVGVDNIPQWVDAIRVYPNPAQQMIHVQSPVPVNAGLFSIDGRLLQQQREAGSFDLNGYAEGIYILQITDGQGLIIRNEKIIKRN